MFGNEDARRIDEREPTRVAGDEFMVAPELVTDVNILVLRREGLGRDHSRIGWERGFLQ
jgi:hypothetical protein